MYSLQCCFSNKLVRTSHLTKNNPPKTTKQLKNTSVQLDLLVTFYLSFASQDAPSPVFLVEKNIAPVLQTSKKSFLLGAQRCEEGSEPESVVAFLLLQRGILNNQ